MAVSAANLTIYDSEIRRAATQDRLAQSGAYRLTTGENQIHNPTPHTPNIGSSACGEDQSTNPREDAETAIDLPAARLHDLPTRSGRFRSLEGAVDQDLSSASPSSLSLANFGAAILSPSRMSMDAMLTAAKPNGRLAETQILLMGKCQKTAVSLQRSMKLAYGHNYTRSDRKAFRINILNNTVSGMKDLLNSIRDDEFRYSNVDSERHAHTILTVPERTNRDSLSPEISHAISALWRDSALLDKFNRKAMANDPIDLK